MQDMHTQKMQVESNKVSPYMIRGGGALKAPFSGFLLSPIKFWNYIIVRWGLFPKKMFNTVWQKNFDCLIGCQDLAVRA